MTRAWLFKHTSSLDDNFCVILRVIYHICKKFTLVISKRVFLFELCRRNFLHFYTCYSWRNLLGCISKTVTKFNTNFFLFHSFPLQCNFCYEQHDTLIVLLPFDKSLNLLFVFPDEGGCRRETLLRVRVIREINVAARQNGRQTRQIGSI